MESLKGIDDVTASVREHTKMIQGFKHDMYMRYNNTDSQYKRNEILNKIQNIEQVMTVIYENYKSECKMLSMEHGQLNELIQEMKVLYEEILTLRY